jgi:nucleoside-diphosphate-sugar epimerase
VNRVLITGAAGFIGSHLTERCLELGSQVVAVDSFTPYYDASIKRQNTLAFASDPDCTFIEDDLVNLDLEAIVSEVDVVFHLAAQAGVRASWGQSFDEYTHANITVLQRLLEAAKETSLERFVFASSSSVYGDAEVRPTTEDSRLLPISPYGATKALGEHLVYLYFRNYQVPAVVLRYFSVYGPRQRPDMAFNRLIRSALTDEEFVLFGDGRQTRDFTYCADTVAATVAAAERGTPGHVYNVGGGSEVSMRDMIDLVASLTGRPPNVTTTGTQRGDARNTAAATGRAERELQFRAEASLEFGLAQQIAWQAGTLGLLAAVGPELEARRTAST